MASAHRMGLLIRPVSALEDAESQTKVRLDGDQPLGIFRDYLGNVTIDAPAVDGKSPVVMMRVNGAKKATEYTDTLRMKQGGSVEAWLRDNPHIKASATFEKDREGAHRDSVCKLRRAVGRGKICSRQ